MSLQAIYFGFSEVKELTHWRQRRFKACTSWCEAWVAHLLGYSSSTIQHNMFQIEDSICSRKESA
jgi:hypothetical protein